MVFLLEHVMLLLDCPVFKSDLFILVQELNQKKKDSMERWVKCTYVLKEKLSLGNFFRRVLLGRPCDGKCFFK